MGKGFKHQKILLVRRRGTQLPLLESMCGAYHKYFVLMLDCHPPFPTLCLRQDTGGFSTRARGLTRGVQDSLNVDLLVGVDLEVVLGPIPQWGRERAPDLIWNTVSGPNGGSAFFSVAKGYFESLLLSKGAKAPCRGSGELCVRGL